MKSLLNANNLQDAKYLNRFRTGLIFWSLSLEMKHRKAETFFLFENNGWFLLTIKPQGNISILEAICGCEININSYVDLRRRFY
jgi:hypothetical protein